MTKTEASQKWLRENSKDYHGRWVVLEGDRLIAAGNTASHVAEVAMAQGVSIPAIAWIPEKGELPFAGW